MQIHSPSFHQNRCLLPSLIMKSVQSHQDVWVASFCTQCVMASNFVCKLLYLVLQHGEALVDDRPLLNQAIVDDSPIAEGTQVRR